jgi:hypothetical protein
LHYTSYDHYCHYINYINYLQVRSDLGIADHIWQDKKDVIGQSVDNLGDQFRPAIRPGRLKYINNAYPDGGAVTAGPAVGIGPLVLPG